MENYESSEEEQELDDEAILKSLYRDYHIGNDGVGGAWNTRLATFLENALHTGATCLICIGAVRRADAIWSCKHCYCFFHLNCIRRWANDSVAQLKAQLQQHGEESDYYNHLGEYVQKVKRKVQWFCPQCRKEYAPTERPSRYECFCSKEVDPPPQLFLVPHSCGEVCGKNLTPECGHKCTLLCHPGPCPPCAQFAQATCICGKADAKSMRCSEKLWQCSNKCGKKLNCGHFCQAICHQKNQCPHCLKNREQSCECGNETKQGRKCADPLWHCDKVCGSKYSCGLHACKKVCHAGACGDCPLGLPRSCPCGKAKKIGPCSEVIDTCGDTCQKLLPCGAHSCTQRCHRGSCNLCILIVKKTCRCGARDKELPCWKEFHCETKCKRTRDCGKHICNKKCCDGQCLPCDKICSKPLSCKKHKCQSICHEGPCYPCRRQSQINCRCGKTSRSVPCGRERAARVLCQELCRIPAKCHHASNHRCHKHDCPPCTRQCALPNTTTGCDHICIAKCHAAVKRLKQAVGVDTTKKWDSKMYEYKQLPHPPCEQKVNVTCLGGHETSDWPCWNAKPTSCQRPCNRSLRCGNHKCALLCHTVSDIQNMLEQPNCESCQDGCTVPRPAGCVHVCPRPCHVPPCGACMENIRKKCHCGLSQVIYKCAEFYSANETEEIMRKRQEVLRSCGNRCIKNLSCGHRCTSICHSGSCSNAEACRKKVRVYCECRTLKADISCSKHQGGQLSIQCDSNCSIALAQLTENVRIIAEKQRTEEETRNRLEVEQFEKKFNKRKYKERKRIVEEEVKHEIKWARLGIYGVVVLAISLAIAAAFYEEGN